MKYAIFALALIGVFPLAFAAMADRRILRLLMFALPLPMAFHSQSSINFFSEELYRGSSRGMEVSLMYLISLAILLAVAFRGKLRGGFFPDWGSRLYLLYVLLTFPSWGAAENTMYAFFEFWKLLMMYLVYRAVWAYLDATGDRETPLAALVIPIVANFLTIVKQHFVGCAQARGLFAHQNSMAMWTLLAGAIFFSAYLNRRKKSGELFWCIGFIAAAAALVRTYSRGSIACFPVACLTVLWTSFRRAFNVRLFTRMIPIVVIGLIGAAALLPKVIDRFENASENSTSMRKAFAVAAMNMIEDEPWRGVGLNNWGIKINPPYEYSEHREEFRMDDEFKDGIVETVYLLTAAECGIPCFIALLLWFGWYLFAALSLAKSFAGTAVFWIPAGIAGGLVGIYLQSVLEWVMRQSVNFGEYMICFALIGWMFVRRRALLAEVKAS